ncbi:hypothetical protein J5751_04270 [bacterium]|nr:hypothetical protein [bacterium]
MSGNKISQDTAQESSLQSTLLFNVYLVLLSFSIQTQIELFQSVLSIQSFADEKLEKKANKISEKEKNFNNFFIFL